jgi:hypothetical protein
MPKNDCIAAIEAFASADPTRLRALPATCTLADATAVLHAPRAKTRGMLGTRDSGLDVHFFASEQLAEITAWVDQTGRLVLLDAERPPGKEAAYLTALGEPDARLDYVWGTSTLEQGELVWTARGAVIVAGPDVKAVVRVGVFAPTSLADYNANLRYSGAETIDEG